MDLIGSLTKELGVGQDSAQALAGGILGPVSNLVSEKLGAATGQQMQAAIPELSGWQKQAASLLGGGAGGLLGAAKPDAGLGGLLGGAAGLLGGGSAPAGLGGMLGSAVSMANAAQGISQLTPIFEKLGLDAGKAAVVLPIVMNFLSTRLPPELMDKVKMVAPLLGAAGGAGSAPSPLGALGKLFG